MAVKIEKDGWSVTGDTVDELLVGIEAIQKWHDIKRELGLRRAEQEEAERAAVAEMSGSGGGEKQKDPYATAIRFLEAIRRHNPATSSVLMNIFGIGDAKGLGGLASGVNRTITETGYQLFNVYRSDRDSTGRSWTAGPLIDDAIEALQRTAGSSGISDEEF